MHQQFIVCWFWYWWPRCLLSLSQSGNKSQYSPYNLHRLQLKSHSIFKCILVTVCFIHFVVLLTSTDATTKLVKVFHKFVYILVRICHIIPRLFKYMNVCMLLIIIIKIHCRHSTQYYWCSTVTCGYYCVVLFCISVTNFILFMNQSNVPICRFCTHSV